MSQDNAAPNAEQIEAWNGAMGEKWVRLQDRLDSLLAPFGEAVLEAAAIKPGEHVLDVGCGCGATTLAAAEAAGTTGRTLGIDISLPMITRARERNAERDLAAAFSVADASRHDFAPGSFDLLISRFGVMFFDAPAEAFANLHRALTKGGRLTFICWRSMTENPWLFFPLRAALPLLPPLPATPPGAPGPFAFADSTHVTTLLTEAGFSDISLTPFDSDLVLGSIDDAVAQSLDLGPLTRVIADLPDDLRKRIATAVRAELEKHVTPRGIALGGATWIVTARA